MCLVWSWAARISNTYREAVLASLKFCIRANLASKKTEYSLVEREVCSTFTLFQIHTLSGERVNAPNSPWPARIRHSVAGWLSTCEYLLYLLIMVMAAVPDLALLILFYSPPRSMTCSSNHSGTCTISSMTSSRSIHVFMFALCKLQIAIHFHWEAIFPSSPG